MKARAFLAVFAIAFVLLAVAPWDGGERGNEPPSPERPVAATAMRPTGPRSAAPRPAVRPSASPTGVATEAAILPDVRVSGDAATPAHTPVPPDPVPAASGAPIYWGVNMSRVPWDMNALEAWEAQVASDPNNPQLHKHVSIVNYGHFWGDAGSKTGYREFSWSAGLLDKIRAHGSIPMISWTPEGGSRTSWRLRDIAEGKHDAYITRFAQGLRDWQGGAPVFLRMMHEMNGNWGYSWQEDNKPNARGEFVKAWQHIVAIFRRNGANNAAFIWCPNVEYAGSKWPSFDSLWPEDESHPHEVDWTCLDGYNRNAPALTFDQVFHYSYDEIVNSTKINRFGPKPMMIGEWGSVDDGGGRAAWFTDALTAQLRQNYVRVKAQVYYDFQDRSYDWRFEMNDLSRAAWSEAIRQAYYASNTFGSLMRSPIPAP